MAAWLRRLFGLGARNTGNAPARRILADLEAEQLRVAEAGSVDGLHYTEYVEHIKELKRQKRHSEAIELLTKLVDATEAEASAAGWGVAPWYYEQLAIVYRKEKRYRDEVAVLERYERQPKAPGAGPSVLSQRLARARELANSDTK